MSKSEWINYDEFCSLLFGGRVNTNITDYHQMPYMEIEVLEGDIKNWQEILKKNRTGSLPLAGHARFLSQLIPALASRGRLREKPANSYDFIMEDNGKKKNKAEKRRQENRERR